MIQRCTNSRRPKFALYGGRGISVCGRWRYSFENFLADMGDRPDGTTLDRVNNDGNYEPGNCRWATPREQSHNKPATKLTANMVNEIRGRAEHGESQRSLAVRFCVTDGHINNVIARRAWGHIQ